MTVKRDVAVYITPLHHYITLSHVQLYNTTCRVHWRRSLASTHFRPLNSPVCSSLYTGVLCNDDILRPVRAPLVQEGRRNFKSGANIFPWTCKWHRHFPTVKVKRFHGAIGFSNRSRTVSLHYTRRSAFAGAVQCCCNSRKSCWRTTLSSSSTRRPYIVANIKSTILIATNK